MAREGISYEQVAAVADALVGDGQQATIRAIRERLGTGSPNTIHRHLAAWRDARPQMAAVVASLPDALTAAIAVEIAKAASASRAEIEGRLVLAQAEASELAAVGEILQGERYTLAAQITIVTTERDREAATAAERATELERQGQDLQRERSAAEAARFEVAQTRNKLENQAEKLTEQQALIAQLRAQLELERQGRFDAEKLAAVTAAKLEAAEHRAQVADAATEELKRQLNQVRELAILESSKAEMANTTIATLNGKIESLQTQVQKQSRELDAAQQEVKTALQAAAELRGQLSSSAKSDQ
jgi:chromosome segregation ATPase